MGNVSGQVDSLDIRVRCVNDQTDVNNQTDCLNSHADDLDNHRSDRLYGRSDLTAISTMKPKMKISRIAEALKVCQMRDLF